MLGEGAESGAGEHTQAVHSASKAFVLGLQRRRDRVWANWRAAVDSVIEEQRFEQLPFVTQATVRCLNESSVWLRLVASAAADVDGASGAAAEAEGGAAAEAPPTGAPAALQLCACAAGAPRGAGTPRIRSRRGRLRSRGSTRHSRTQRRS